MPRPRIPQRPMPEDGLDWGGDLADLPVPRATNAHDHSAYVKMFTDAQGVIGLNIDRDWVERMEQLVRQSPYSVLFRTRSQLLRALVQLGTIRLLEMIDEEDPAGFDPVAHLLMQIKVREMAIEGRENMHEWRRRNRGNADMLDLLAQADALLDEG